MDDYAMSQALRTYEEHLQIHLNCPNGVILDLEPGIAAIYSSARIASDTYMMLRKRIYRTFKQNAPWHHRITIHCYFGVSR